MGLRPRRPPASITSCLLQKLWHLTRWLAPGLEPGSARLLKAALRGIYCGADRAHSLHAPLHATPACLQRVKWTQSVSNSKARAVGPWKRAKVQRVKLRVKNNDVCTALPSVHVLSKVQRMFGSIKKSNSGSFSNSYVRLTTTRISK